LDIPAVFWKKMDHLPAVRKHIPSGAEKALKKMLPDSHLSYRLVTRVAGIGSLGHARYVAVAEWHGGQIALEAKAAVPSACAWASSVRTAEILYQKALEQAVRARIHSSA
jgi:uncharacterized protein (DUF2252 family)